MLSKGHTYSWEDRATLGSDPSAQDEGRGDRGSLWAEQQCLAHQQLPAGGPTKDPLSSQSDKPTLTDPPDFLNAVLEVFPGSSVSDEDDTEPPDWFEDHRRLCLSLDTIETSLHAGRFRYLSGWQRLRDEIASELERNGSPEDKKRAAALRACSTRFGVYVRGGVPELHPLLCRQRICPICRTFRSWSLKPRIRAAIKLMRYPKLLTFTLKASDDPISVQCRRLTAAFAKLRRRAVFKAACSGGCWVVEYKQRPETDQWHVHLHCLIDARWIDQKWLSSAWQQITGDSFIVDIRVADQRAANYLTKYLTKNSVVSLSGQQLRSHIADLAGIRLYGTWGNVKLPKDEKLLDVDSVFVGDLGSVCYRASNGDSLACMILSALGETYGFDVSTIIPPDSS